MKPHSLRACIFVACLLSGLGWTRGTAAPAPPQEREGFDFDAWPWQSIKLQSAYVTWASAQTRSNILVAVIDNGFAVAHPSLRDRLWSMPGRSSVHGWDFVWNDSNPEPNFVPPDDAPDHGTIVARIIGGASFERGPLTATPRPPLPPAGRRSAGAAGGSQNAELMLIRFNLHTAIHPSKRDNPLLLSRALEFAVTNGARIVNLSATIDSFGKPPGALAALELALNLAANRGVLVIAAAGNEPDHNLDTSPTTLLASCPLQNLIIVTGHDRNRRLVNSFGARSVDLAAPAQGIPAALFPGDYTAYGENVAASSFATPIVAAAAALTWGLMPNLNASEVRCLLLTNAVSVGPNPMGRQWGHAAPARTNGVLDLSFLAGAHANYVAFQSGQAFTNCCFGLSSPRNRFGR